MNLLKLDYNIGAAQGWHDGVFSFILPPEQYEYKDFDMDKWLVENYNRKGLCLKVFKDEITYGLSSFFWGYKPEDKRNKVKESLYLTDATIIQNLFAWHGFAPRVYDIVYIETPKRTYFAQVTDFLSGEFTKPNHDALKFMKTEYPLKVLVDPNERNWIDGKLVDFQNIYFSDKKKYEETLEKKALTTTDWGSKSGIAYEDIPELGLEGQRDTEHRIKVLGLDNQDWRGQTIVDFGCSNGSFCREIARSPFRPSRIIGIDLPHTAKTAYEISNYFGYWNIDFYGYTFSKDKPEDYNKITEMIGLDSVDTVLFLSVHAQIGYPTTWMNKFCKKRIFVEGHSGHNEQTYRPLLEEDFDVVEYRGHMKNNARPALEAWNEDN